MNAPTPLQNLPVVACQDCDWERRSLPENRELLVLAGRAHMTETDGHLVMLFDAETES